MCYLVVKDKNQHGCYAMKTMHGKLYMSSRLSLISFPSISIFLLFDWNVVLILLFMPLSLNIPEIEKPSLPCLTASRRLDVLNDDP